MPCSNVPERLARLGYGARGTVYLIVGGLALLAAIGSGGRATGSKGALQTVLKAPFGALLLAIIAIGLLCFAAWRLAQGFLDADQLGRKRKVLLEYESEPVEIELDAEGPRKLAVAVVAQLLEDRPDLTQKGMAVAVYDEKNEPVSIVPLDQLQ